jgi:hypothetical protein
METSKNENDIAPLIPDSHTEETTIKKMECFDFLQCGTCSLIILFTCFKP